jgi:hypothetical protein
MGVRLDRACDRTHPCSENVSLICAGYGQHAYGLRCASCKSPCGHSEDAVVEFLQKIIAKFGVPTSPVCIKSIVEGNSGLQPVCAPAALPAYGMSSEVIEMAKKSEAFPSTCYRAADVTSPLLLTIDKVTVERFGEGREAKDKYVASFKERGSKKLVVSSTKWDGIALIARSDDSDDWPGTQIVLYSDKVPFGGKLVDGIKIRAPKTGGIAAELKPAPQPVATGGAVATAAKDLDDEIPF